MSKTRNARISFQDFDVKNVKFFQGMEMGGYNASLYLKGKRIAMCIDGGDGGAPLIRFLTPGKGRGFTYDVPQEIADWMKTEEGQQIQREFWLDRPRSDNGVPQDFIVEQSEAPLTVETLVDVLLARHEEARLLKKTAKRYGLVFRPKGARPDKLLHYDVPKKFEWTKVSVEEALEQARKKHGEIEVLANPIN